RRRHTRSKRDWSSDVCSSDLMLRLKTPEYLKILQADGFEASYGGAESNVAVSLAMFGDKAAYVTKIPDNPVGLAALGAVRRFGVDRKSVVQGERVQGWVLVGS